jgi:hypothetical protein
VLLLLQPEATATLHAPSSSAAVMIRILPFDLIGTGQG